MALINDFNTSQALASIFSGLNYGQQDYRTAGRYLLPTSTMFDFAKYTSKSGAGGSATDIFTSGISGALSTERGVAGVAGALLGAAGGAVNKTVAEQRELEKEAYNAGRTMSEASLAAAKLKYGKNLGALCSFEAGCSERSGNASNGSQLASSTGSSMGGLSSSGQAYANAMKAIFNGEGSNQGLSQAAIVCRIGYCMRIASNDPRTKPDDLSALSKYASSLTEGLA